MPLLYKVDYAQRMALNLALASLGPTLLTRERAKVKAAEKSYQWAWGRSAKLYTRLGLGLNFPSEKSEVQQQWAATLLRSVGMSVERWLGRLMTSLLAKGAKPKALAGFGVGRNADGARYHQQDGC